jgi:hypothetical protein
MRLALSVARPTLPAISDTAWRDAPLAQPSADSRRPDGGSSIGTTVLAGSVATQPAAAPAKPAAPPPPARLFAGRELDWWKARLVKLRKAISHPPALYEATLRAARANGLVVTEVGEELSVTFPAQDAEGQEKR